MAAFKSLLDTECGATNPLVKLSQCYTHDNTHITQDGINKHHRSILVPNTFHLESLLTSLRSSDKTVDQRGYEWTEEFLHSLSNDVPLNSVNDQFVSSIQSEPIPWNEQNYIPSPSSFILHPIPTFLVQQPSLIDTGFDNDIVKATQNILSFLQERELAVNTEDQTFVERVTDINDKIMKQSNEEERQDDINSFEEGLKCLEVHDIANAILCFQAAVQKKPDHIDAWFCLGLTQTENEQDGPAIAALQRCVELDSKHLQAYITLASCYANEMLKKEAFDSLYKWLINNDKYSHLLSNQARMVDQLTFEQLQRLFLQAVLLANTPNEIDSDLQVCLGILFYLNNDYDKAAECFYTAVLAKPNDALVWNKLGTAIANGGHNEKAVNAYYHALRLSPGFIRARYNLGISCLNLNAYKQAIEHFLIALKQQNNGIGTHVETSESIWQTLASAINRWERLDLEQSVVYRDLPKLLREFQIE